MRVVTDKLHDFLAEIKMAKMIRDSIVRIAFLETPSTDRPDCMTYAYGMIITFVDDGMKEATLHEAIISYGVGDAINSEKFKKVVQPTHCREMDKVKAVKAIKEAGCEYRTGKIELF
jgi:hypothetical protein